MALPRLIAAEQQVNCDDSQVNVALPRLNAAGQQVNCDESQVKSCVAAVKGDGLEGNQSQGDDSPATPLRLTSSSAAINCSEAAPRSSAHPLPAHLSPLISHRSNGEYKTGKFCRARQFLPVYVVAYKEKHCLFIQIIIIFANYSIDCCIFAK